MASKGKAPDPLFVLRTQNTEVTALCFGENNCLFSGGIDGSITMWDLQTRRATAKFQAHNKTILCSHPAVQSLFVSNAGLISQGRDGTVKLWDYSNLKNNIVEPINTIDTNCTSFTSCSYFQPSQAITLQTKETVREVHGVQEIEEDDSAPISFLTEQLKAANITEIQVEPETENEDSEIKISTNPIIAAPSESSEQVFI